MTIAQTIPALPETGLCDKMKGAADGIAFL